MSWAATFMAAAGQMLGRARARIRLSHHTSEHDATTSRDEAVSMTLADNSRVQAKITTYRDRDGREHQYLKPGTSALNAGITNLDEWRAARDTAQDPGRGERGIPPPRLTNQAKDYHARVQAAKALRPQQAGADPIHKSTNDLVIRKRNNGQGSSPTQAGGNSISTNAPEAVVPAASAAAAGSTGQVSDAGHVHSIGDGDASTKANVLQISATGTATWGPLLWQS